MFLARVVNRPMTAHNNYLSTGKQGTKPIAQVARESKRRKEERKLAGREGEREREEVLTTRRGICAAEFQLDFKTIHVW